jgi:2-polyprenyl-6-hydroxyphenyl methylase/3-demethylubiquinone-9 3-methyltransferase
MQLREAWLRAMGKWTRSEKWDTQYAAGKWDYLQRLDELGRYSVLAGYVQWLKPNGVVLDVGCGAGLLRERLHPAAYSRYVGLDFAEAVTRAQPLADERTAFVVGDMHDYVPGETFDVVVFNEVATYFADPVAGLERYVRFLRPGGVFLISMFMAPRATEIWALLDGRYPVIDEVLISNAAGTTWICKALAGRPE